ncbi:murein biosynthesis integral membrane protein MurJ [Roseiflexus castenholzii]|jgi:putative peptidoglycan lipid II flippase|uniref:Virulence factor MVIN family protein n=1 Tax=Roseiflexus castenholzii (strain DSM 13941 / HLO8) TaxID=383372 RepID=A7NH04_ROSCS|nr:murein biosynthesis integral membrane protein MurJ [Roseiflexus castenholzii]ABU56751.1 virulence factor MVIN family protein [Roseiflexus castenholzii DSM 13941]
MIRREFSIAEGTLLFTTAYVISAGLGIVRQALFNAGFGAGMEASAYYAAFRLPDTIASLIGGGALSNAMIPALLGARYESGDVAEQRLVNLTATTLTVAVSLVVLVCMIFAPFFVRFVLAPGFDAETAALTIALTRIMLAQLALVVLASVAIAVLNARNQFLLTAISIVTHNVTMIGGILAARFIPGVGIYGPAFGVVGDAILQLIILCPGLRANRFRVRPAWDLRDARLRQLFRLLAPNGLSSGVNYAGGIVDTAFASLAREAGALPALFNAGLLMGVPLRLIGVALAQAAFPRIAAYAARNDRKRLRRTLLAALAGSMTLAVAAALTLALIGRALVRLLFERGRFDAAASDLTTLLLGVYIAGLPMYVATEVLTRGLIALHDTQTPLVTNCAQLAGRGVLIWVWIEPWGVVAIPAAFAITSVLETVALGAALAWRMRRRREARGER